MKNPLNKLIVPFLSLFISGTVVIILHSCSQEKQAENKDSQQTEAVATAWSASGEWVQKLTVSPTNIVRNTTWGQDFSTINDSLEVAESQPEKGKSYTLYFDDTDLNFSDITYIPNDQNKLQEITFDIFVDSAEDVQPLIDQWKGYLEVKFGPSETKGTQVLWTKNKNTRIQLENVSTPKDPGIKISFKAAN
ncbi:hypothetical protein [Aquirufa novilacunae]|jgi:hypothetical protein|uniref:Lipoprotein n=1 Tax=Aquirufa novilacunae TaxID=3139305 RepID=A0ABW8U4U7_9BACT